MNIFTKVQIMNFPIKTSQCSNRILKPNVFIHMYYIFFNENLYIETIKEKRKCHYSPTTPTTLLKAALSLINNVVPTCFLFTYYNLLQPTTFLRFAAASLLSCLFIAFYTLYYVVGEKIFLQIIKNAK